MIDDVIAGNPMAAVGKPKVPRAAPQSLSADDITRLLEVLRSGEIPARRPWSISDYAVIATLAVTEPRASEIIDLTLGDVEGEPGERQIAVRHGKGEKYRAVPVDPRLDDLLAAYLEDRWRRFPLRRINGLPRYLACSPRMGIPGCWDRHDFLPLSLMIRGVLSPVLVVSVDR